MARHVDERASERTARGALSLAGVGRAKLRAGKAAVRISVCAVLVVLALAALAGLGSVGAALATNHDKVALCHATGNSDTFPAEKYVLIEPDASGAFNGHLGGGHQNGNDIIPPFEYQGQTYSQNWNAVGQPIFAAGCSAPDDEEPPLEPPVVPPTVVPPVDRCPPGQFATAGKDGEEGNDECEEPQPGVPIEVPITRPGPVEVTGPAIVVDEKSDRVVIKPTKPGIVTVVRGVKKEIVGVPTENTGEQLTG